MKYNELKRLLGTVAIAATASLTACGTEATQPIDTTVEAESTQVDEEPTPTPTPTETKITVSYEDSATDSDELTMIGDNDVSYIIKDYDANIYYETLLEQDYDFQLDEETESIYIGETLASENVDFKEDGTLWVRDVVIEENIPVVKYVRTETEVEARYIGTAPNDSNLVSGITFVMEKNEDGYYKLTGMRGVFDEDITDLEVYEGTFDGWSMEVGGDVIYEEGDEIKISGNLTLYPHFIDNEASKVAAEDGTCLDDNLEEIEIDGVKHTVLRVIHIKGTKTDAKTGEKVACEKYALAGLDSKKDTVKTKDGQTIDKDKVEKQQTEEKDPAAKTDPQTSKKSNESPKPGQEKPASSANEQSQAEDTANRTDEVGNTTDTAIGAAAWGVPTSCDFASADSKCDGSNNLSWE